MTAFIDKFPVRVSVQNSKHTQKNNFMEKDIL